MVADTPEAVANLEREFALAITSAAPLAPLRG
jgi:hypothetical protein